MTFELAALIGVIVNFIVWLNFKPGWKGYVLPFMGLLALIVGIFYEPFQMTSEELFMVLDITLPIFLSTVLADIIWVFKRKRKRSHWEDKLEKKK